ncbi:mitochondrial O-FucT_like domain-containing protein [Andalucia godoyi]|uniref:Mitochondrial O-FucT_like domain-containing protein n=1 Tax=Andalucia godoyi TaxID=505711 RepID=A0A8K0AHN5_ANDGO|nr:mitochondrial O-FucT_like domain-containing protein [Andalucia godoyi]|eukprot:ANDGO_05730.mRNA.1 mitochondrial O-FucT_like domain-containing protein
MLLSVGAFKYRLTMNFPPAAVWSSSSSRKSSCPRCSSILRRLNALFVVALVILVISGTWEQVRLSSFPHPSVFSDEQEHRGPRFTVQEIWGDQADEDKHEEQLKDLQDRIDFLKKSHPPPLHWDYKVQMYSEETISNNFRKLQQSGQYLFHVEVPLFDPRQRTEQFNALRLNVMEMILVSMVTGRQLFEPWILGQLRNSTFYEVAAKMNVHSHGVHDVLFSGPVLFSEIFDTTFVEKFLQQRLIPHSEYYKMLGGRIQNLRTVDPSSVPSLFLVDGRTWIVENQVTFDREFGKRSLNTKDLHDYFGTDIDESVLTVHTIRGKITGNSPNWHESFGMLYWNIRKCLEFNGAMYARAALALQRLDVPKDYHFLAFHWRRGDRGHPEMGRFGSDHMEKTSPRRVGIVIKRLLEYYRMSMVFVATNSGLESDWQAFVNAVAPYRAVKLDARSGADFRKEKYMHNMAAEEIIASSAAVFVSDGSRYSSCSTVSRIILEERILHYKPYMMKPLFIYDLLEADPKTQLH